MSCEICEPFGLVDCPCCEKSRFVECPSCKGDGFDCEVCDGDGCIEEEADDYYNEYNREDAL